jgi:hypothetical protein
MLTDLVALEARHAQASLTMPPEDVLCRAQLRQSPANCPDQAKLQKQQRETLSTKDYSNRSITTPRISQGRAVDRHHLHVAGPVHGWPPVLIVSAAAHPPCCTPLDPIQVLRYSIAPWLTAWLRCAGSASFFSLMCNLSLYIYVTCTPSIIKGPFSPSQYCYIILRCA